MGRDDSYFVFLYFSDSGSRLCFISCACFLPLFFLSFYFFLLSIPSLSFSLCLLTPFSLSLSLSLPLSFLFDPWVHWAEGVKSLLRHI